MNLLFGLLRFRRFRQLYRQQPLGEAGVDFGQIYAVGHAKAALKGPVPTLGQVIIFVLIFLTFGFFAPDSQRMVRQLDLDIVIVEAGSSAVIS